MANQVGSVDSKGFLATNRRDLWWLQPLAVLTILIVFVVYATWAAFAGGNEMAAWPRGAEHPTYLSPFYSPDFVFNFGKGIGFPFPIFFILWMPLGFRFTCYFARRTYYRSFMADPVGCAVSEMANRKYNGESKFPLILQNLHRYFLYLAIGLVAVHWVDLTHAFRFPAEGGGTEFGVGIGSLVLMADAVFLTLYVFSCHSLRHLVGGKLDCFTCHNGKTRPRYKIWQAISRANENHGLYFWLSLLAVGFADVYVRFLASSSSDRIF